MHRSSLEAASDFYTTSPGVRLFRLALATFQRLWPALAVRAADRLFGTPMPPRWLQRRKSWDPSWHIERWPFEDASMTVYSQGAAPHGPVELLVLLAPQFEPDAVGPRIRIPTLVVHDREDRINRFADGQTYAHAVRGADLLATDGLGHRKILKEAGVLGRVALFTR